MSDRTPVTFDAAENEPMRSGRRGVLDERALETGQVDPPVRVLADRDDVGDGLTPGQLVAVVLVGADEDDRSLVGRDVRAQRVAVVEVGRDPELEDVDELVDRRRSSPSRRR